MYMKSNHTSTGWGSDSKAAAIVNTLSQTFHIQYGALTARRQTFTAGLL